VPDRPDHGRPIRLTFGAALAALAAGRLGWHFWPNEVQLLAVRQLTRDGRQ
jgi:hypothetical protein